MRGRAGTAWHGAGGGMNAEEYRCRECQIPLRYLGWGRPPVWCEAHRPATSPPLRHQLNGGVYEPSLPGFPDPTPPTRYTEVSAHRRRVSGPPSAPLARSSDPETSREAAKHTNPDRTERAILDSFATYGPMTDDELADRLPDWYAPTVRTARSRLSRAGFLRASGEGFSKRNRRMSVWALAQAQREVS